MFNGDWPARRDKCTVLGTGMTKRWVDNGTKDSAQGCPISAHAICLRWIAVRLSLRMYALEPISVARLLASNVVREHRL
jgi:hypothetical protein